MMITTDWVEYTEQGHTYRVRATYGFDIDFARRHNQLPHFSITGESEVKRGKHWREDMCGCLHDLIVEHFPQLKELIRCHLASTNEPLHYMANALFWFDERQLFDPTSVPYAKHDGYLKSTIVYGARLADYEFDLANCTRDQLKDWLSNRKPSLMAIFRKTMEDAGVTFP